MKCVFNQTNIERIMNFLKENLNYAIKLNDEETKEMINFFKTEMFWNNFKNAIIEIEKESGETYFAAEKDCSTFDKYRITKGLDTIHRIYKLDEILRELGPTPDFPLEIKFLDSVELFREQSIGLKELPYTELLRGEELINKEEEENMLKLLEIYKDKKTKEIEEKYDKEIEELIKNDPVQIFIEQAEETVKTMLNSKNVKVYLNSDVGEITSETIEKQNEIVDIIMEEKAKLNTKIKEISALLELAPNYEEKIKILRDYEIVDKKKNIIL